MSARLQPTRRGFNTNLTAPSTKNTLRAPWESSPWSPDSPSDSTFETISYLDLKLSKKSLPDLKMKVKNLLTKVPDKPVPEWDSID